MPFNTFDATGASVTVTDLLDTDVHIHKDGGLEQRNSAIGVEVEIDYDSITGNHLITIHTSDNTVADFYQAGHDYKVRLEGITVATKTLNVWVGTFSIENRNIKVDVVKISGDSTAADNFETMLDGTGTKVLTLAQLRIDSTAAGGAIDIDNSGGNGISVDGLANDIVGDITGNLSGSIGSLGTTAKTDVNTEVDSALDTAIPGSATAGSVNQSLKDLKDIAQAQNG